VRRFEIWNGLALAVLDESRRGGGALVDREIYDAAALNRRMRDVLSSEAGANGADPSADGEGEPGHETSTILERFVPGTMRSGLVAAEHLARYWWASQFAKGRRVLDAGCGMGYGSAILAEAGAAQVTGVDISAPAIEAARATAGGAAFEVGDIASLPLSDNSVDLVVCLETIEHVEEPERALDELARVLVPEGLLVLSSPNRDVYPPGNPHHRCEFTPAELRDELRRRFREVELMRQHDWTASAILDDADFAADGGVTLSDVVIRKLVGHEPGRETYTLALATNAAVPDAPAPLALTHSVEFREWLENYDSQERILREQADALRNYETLERERLELRERLEEAELRLARVPELELALTARDRDRADLRRQLDGLDRAHRDVMSSPSWRITQPLRRAKALVRQILSP
jgi:2-polyprenyl-3-methyl-5-hydroxy-6-metoxy-1,4-benzoquinol methylase